MLNTINEQEDVKPTDATDSGDDRVEKGGLKEDVEGSTFIK